MWMRTKHGKKIGVDLPADLSIEVVHERSFDRVRWAIRELIEAEYGN